MANVFDRSPLGRLADEWEREAQLPLVLPQPKAEGAEPTRAQPPSDRPAAGAPADSRAPSVTSTTKDGKIVPPKDLVPLFTQAARKYKVPVNVLAALAAQESSFNPLAEGEETEYGRAKGLMQYLDSTAQSLGINPYDPAQAIDAAARQIRERLDRGYSMDEAVREHFAGPDRKKWGPKTERYGVEVLDKARRVDRTIFAPQQPAPKAEGQAAPGGQPDDEQFRRAAELVSRPQPTGSIGPAPERGIIDELGTAFQTVIGRTGAGGEDKRPLIARLEDAAGRVVDAVTPDSLQRGVRRGKQALMAAGDGLMPESVYGKEQDRFATAAVIGGLEREAARFPQDPARQAALVRIGEAKGFGEAAREIVKNPGAVADVVLESLGVAVPQLAVTSIAGAAGGAPASVIGAGASSFSTEYAQAILEAVQNAAGGDLTDVYDVARAMNDPEIMAAARERGVKRGIPIAVFDALTAGLAGQIIRRTRGAVQGTLGAAGEAAVQGLGGMAGETGAQLATDEWKPGEILLEGFAEVPTAAIEAPGNIAHARRNQRAQERDIANAAGTIDQLDEAGMATTAADLVTPRHDPPVSDAIDPDLLRQANEQMAAAQQPTPPPPQRSPMQSALDAATQAVAAAQPAQRAVLDIPSEGVSIEGQIVQQDETGTLFRTDDGREFMVPAGDPDATVRPAVAPEAELVQPEPVADTLAQIEAIRDPSSAKDAALITPNSEIPEGALDGLAVVETSQGLFVTSNPEKAAAAQVVGGQLTPDQVGELLGYTTPKDQNDGTVVQATDAAGNVVHEEATNAANLEAAAARAEEMAPDGGQVQITDAVQALGRREQGVAGEPAPASAAKRPLAEYSEPELRARLKYLRGQAKTSGWNKALIEERRAVEAEIDRRAVAAKETTDAVGQQPTPGDERVRGAEAAAPAGSGEQAGGAADARGAAGRRGGAEAAVPAVPEDVAGAGAAAEPQPALSPAPAEDPHAGKWFGSREKAEAYIAKKKAGDTHEVVQTGRVRFEIKPKAAAAPDGVDEATAEFRRIRAPGNVVEDATGKVLPVTATNGREITITRRDGTSETVQASGYSPAVPKHPNAKFDLGDRVIHKGRAGEIESFAYPREGNGQPRYNVAFDDGVPSDSIAQNDLKREQPKAAAPSGSVSAKPRSDLDSKISGAVADAEALSRLVDDANRRSLNKRDEIMRQAKEAAERGEPRRPPANIGGAHKELWKLAYDEARKGGAPSRAESDSVSAAPVAKADQGADLPPIKADELAKLIADVTRRKARAGVKDGRVEIDGRPVAVAERRYTSADEALEPVARRYVELMQAEGRTIPTDPAQMSRDQFVMINELSGLIGEFEITGEDIGNLVRTSAGGGLSVDYDALYDRVQADARGQQVADPRNDIADETPVVIINKRTGQSVDIGIYRGTDARTGSARVEVAPGEISFRHPDAYEIRPMSGDGRSQAPAEKSEPTVKAKRGRAGAAALKKLAEAAGLPLDDTANRDTADMIAFFDRFYEAGRDGRDMPRADIHPQDARAAYEAGRKDRKAAAPAQAAADSATTDAQQVAPSPAPAATKAEAGGQQGAEPSTSQKHAEIDRGFEENGAAIERMGLRKGDTVSVPFGQERRAGTIKSIDVDQGSLEIEIPGGRGGPMSLRVDARYAAKVEPEAGGRAAPLNDDFGNYAIPTGSQLVSQSGRELSPSPKWDDSTPRKRALSLKRQRAWLVDEAIKESEAGGPAQDFQAGMLRRINPDNLSRSDFDTVNDVLFGDPDGPKPEHFRAAPAKPAKAPAARKPSESARVEAKAGPEAAPATNDAEWGANNTLVTRERAAELRERLKKKLAGQLNSGIDPEVLAIGAELAAFHIEAGARRFADFARAIARDLDTTPQALRQYLRAWYNAGRDLMEDSGRDVSDMNTPDEVRAELAALVANDQGDTDEQPQPLRSESGSDAAGRDQAGAEAGPAGAGADGARGAEAQRAAGELPEPADRDGGGDDQRGVGPDSGRDAGDDRPAADRADGEPDRGAGQRDGAGAGDRGDRRAGRDAGGRSAGRGAKPVRADGPVSAPRDYRIQPGELARDGGWKATAERNVQIVELVKALEKEGRQPTDAERALMTRFTGWGASEIANGIFPDRTGRYKDGWQELGERLKAALTPEEYETARRSTQYAHYTSEGVIRSIYQGLERLGFGGGRVLEPGMGVGLFKGLMPDAMAANSQYTGIEYDRITGAIAKYLYPASNVLVEDFTKTRLPRDFFDAAIGNPPFSQTRITNDPEYKKHGFLLHDYFFAKTIDRVKPGGLVVFVTSKGTMDKANDRARRYLADRADLLGAVRLPQTAFKGNAGTEVVTDVLFLRKRMPGEKVRRTSAGAALYRTNERGEAVGQPVIGVNDWLGLAEVQTPQGPAQVNEYFAAHPEMVLGEHAKTGSMYRANEYTVVPRAGEDIEQAFARAVQNLPEAVYRPDANSQAAAAAVRERDFNPTHKKEGGLYLADDGTLMRVNQGVGEPVTHRVGSNGKPIALTPKNIQWLKDWVGLRDALKAAHRDQLNDGDWEASLKALNQAYDRFVKKHGPILAHSRIEREGADGETTVTLRFKNAPLYRMDVEGVLASALEVVNEDGTIERGAVLKGRVLKKPTEPTIRTVQDAMMVQLNRDGRLNIDQVAKLAGTTREAVIAELDSAIYEDPAAGWITADEYLSGNVVRKLEEARAAAAQDRRYQRNVDALLAVQPRPLAPSEITVRLGANWVPADDIAAFAREVLGNRVDVTYNERLGSWSAVAIEHAPSEYSTARMTVAELLDALLNNQQITVRDTIPDGEGGRTSVVNTQETEAANDRARKIKDAFSRWLWSDPDRTDRLTTYYNQHFNNIVPRQFDGSHLTLPGVSLRFSLRPHQKRAIWRNIQQGDTYYAHAVGAGKTFTAIAAGMEQRRLGLINKPAYVVPNHMLNQFSREFLELYPTANIMVADEHNFHTNNRRQFIAQAALNDPDAIILTHSSFGRVGMSPEFQKQYIESQIDEWKAALDEVDSSDRITKKGIEQRIEQLERRLEAKMAEGSKDQVMTFEELGVDYLFVDEAHEFRKLDFATNQARIKGIDPQGSQRAFDLHMKVEYLRGKRPGRSLTMMSGTPVTNTMGELFTVQRFFQPDQLEEDGLASFDAWASQYGDIVTGLEQNAAGGYQQVSRFAKFQNVPELMHRIRSFMDILTSDQLGDLVQRPAVAGGQREIVVVPAEEGYRAYQKTLEQRIKAIAERRGPPKPGDDIILNVIGDGRFSAIDMRFVEPGRAPSGQSKLDRMLDQVIEDYRASADWEYTTDGKKDERTGAALMVFTDIGLGEQSAEARGFDMKAWIEKRLTDAGIPREHIAFMRDYKQHAKKEKLFADVREGRKRILIGGKDMETGVNVQKRLAFLYHLDAPWFPASVEQREGRIIRQGNQNRQVTIRAYATKGSYDSTMWGMNARKQRFIDQAMSGNDSVRSMEDVSESSAFEMAAALASGDERYLKLAGLRGDVERLTRLANAHHDEQRKLRRDREASQDFLRNADARRAAIEEAIERRQPIKAGEFRAKVGEETFDSRDEFSGALYDAFKELSGKAFDGQKKIGEIGGFDILYNGHLGRGGTYSADVTLDLPEYPSPLIEYPLPGGFAVNGIAARAANQVMGLDKALSDLAERRAATERRLATLENRIGAAFPEQGELLEKQAELAELEAELAREQPADQPASAAAEGMDSAERGVQADGPSVLEAADGGAPSAAPAAVRRPSPAHVAAAIENGRIDAEELGLRAAVEKVLGAKVASRVIFHRTYDALPDRLRAGIMRRMEQRGGRGQTGALYDPETGRVYVFTHVVKTPDRAVWNALHELAGHHGLRSLLGDRLGQALQVADQNETVSRVADAIARERNIPRARRQLAVEEALAELAAAVGTGNFDHIRDRYGVEVSDGMRARVQGAIRNFLRRLKELLNDLFGRPVFTDEDVRALLEAARAAATVRVGPPGQRGIGLDAVEAGQTDSPAFRRWFGDSKIVDSAGNPMRVFHGTMTDLQHAVDAKAPLYVTNSPRYANYYAAGEPTGSPLSWDGQTYPVGDMTASEQRAEVERIERELRELASREPSPEDYEFLRMHQGALDYIREAGIADSLPPSGAMIYRRALAIEEAIQKTTDERQRLTDEWRQAQDRARIATPNVSALYAKVENPYRTDNELLIYNLASDPEGIASLKARGYDGVIWSPEGIDAQLDGTVNVPYGAEILVFDASRQIKSATANRGTFDPDSPNILENVEPEIEVDPARIRMEKKPLREAVGGALTTLKRHGFLPMTPLNYLVDYARGALRDAVAAYVDTKRNMDTYRGEKHAAYDAHAQRWLAWAAKNPAASAALGQLMHDSTIAQIDPSEELPAKLAGDAGAVQRYNALRERFEALPEEGQALYRDTRDLYKAQAAELDAIIEANVGKQMDLARERADAAYRQELAEIRDSGMEGDERAAAEAAAKQRHVDATAGHRFRKQARMLRLRQMLESNRLAGPYFPLARFGDYTVSIRDAGGELVSFSRFEKPGDAAWFAKQARSTWPSMQVEEGVLTEKEGPTGAVGAKFMADLEEILGGSNVPDSLRDEVWQRYLMTMPDFSMRKRFIHRKGTPGYHRDPIRAFGSAMFHGAHQMARLKYGPDLTAALREVQKTAIADEDGVNAGILANELKKRHDWVLDPKGAAWAQAISSGAFIWNLAVSPAAALVNLTQTYVLGVPVLGSRLGGVTRALAELSKASAQLFSARGFHLSNRVKGDELRAMEEFYKLGLIDRTQSHDLAGVGETGVEYSVTRQKWMARLSFLFHHAERVNREVTALAAYRLARQRGQGHDAAVKTAAELTWLTHFDYSNSSRARYAQSDVAKVLLIHKQHSLNMTYRLFRDLNDMLRGATPEERKIARSQFVGVMAMHGIMAGVRGLPFYSIAMVVAGLLKDAFGDDDDDREPEDIVKAWLYDSGMPRWMADTLLYGAPSVATGLDISSRVGFPDLFFRSPNKELEGRAEAEYWTMQILGAAAAIPVQVWTGVNTIREGNVARGVEQMMPKFVRDVLKAGRYAREGALTFTGDPIVDEMRAWELVGQAAGFTPFELSKAYDENNARKRLETAINNRRARLMNRYALAWRMEDEAAMDELEREFERFNDAYPEKPITAQGVRSSIRSRERRSARSSGGLVLDSKLEERINRELGLEVEAE